ncbi:MAG: UDP-N-acetylglucosamine--N-acetylmuramyl-(pentapeptide) pyrophosphoryl-undecaprenol N-acetylglucosamine transferase [Opitutia bacterium UBA7350]|nr:MAG: UDP-N-acetylglucosamine--N-acetylmuramyl-(pentapeptide) pyrophosphoryl-undecaprenol N-acetylglucosamine transferase [Opitutae bacterium UBA7350]
MSTILIACGGTGGHLAPGIALAEVFVKEGHRCLLLVSQKTVDSALIRKYESLDFIAIPGQGFSGGIWQGLSALWSLYRSLRVVLRLIRQESPDLVFLLGGFLSAGPGLAARLGGIPVVLHEANSAPGRVTRWLAPLAERVYLPAGLSLENVASEKLRHPGYPVRQEIAAIPIACARASLRLDLETKLLVVIGGSQGARALNDWAEENFESLAESGISIFCVSGLQQAEAQKTTLQNRAGKLCSFTRVEFTDQMATVLSAADLVVSRAGAGSIAELAACRRPAVLIPYPYAADDHQTANALALEATGGGHMLAQSQLGLLAVKVKNLIFDIEALKQMQGALEKIDPTNTAKDIAQDLLTLTRARQTSKTKSGNET